VWISSFTGGSLWPARLPDGSRVRREPHARKGWSPAIPEPHSKVAAKRVSGPDQSAPGFGPYPANRTSGG
jgi:hypothetical protein